MKKLIIVIGILLLNVTSTFSQNFSFKYSEDSTQVAKRIEKLAEELVKLKYDPKSTKDLSQLYEIQIIVKQYDDALKTISNLRILYKEDYLTFHKVIALHDEVYIRIQKQKQQKKIQEISFNKILDSIYLNVDSSTKEDSFIYLTLNTETFLKRYKDNLEKTKGLDSISKKDAISLCRTYISYLVSLETSRKGKLYVEKEENKKYFIQDSLLITTRDNAKLSGLVYRKKSDTVPKPVILNFSIYPYQSGNSRQPKLSVKNGYVGVSVFTRGKRYSDGEIISFEKDSEDLYDVIDWISKQPWCDGQVGMYGGSYLGFAQWAVNKNPHPALKTIVPMVSVGSGIDYPMYNNVFMSYMLRWIHYVENNKYVDNKDFDNGTKWNSLYKNWYKEGTAFNTLDSMDKRPSKTFQRWLKHPSYDSYWQNMMPYQKDFKKINIPILSFTGYFDADQVGALHYLKEHYKYNSNPNHYLIIGPYDHSGAQGTPSKKIQGYTIDSIANIKPISMTYKWFDYVLKDSVKPKFLKDKINYQVMGTNMWKAKPSLDEVSNNNLKLYLNNVIKKGSFTLTTNKPKENGYIEEHVDFLNRKDAESFQISYGTILDSILDKKNGKVFISEVFQEDFEMTGSLKGTIDLIINKKDLDISIELYEYTEEGKYFALSTYLGRASYAKNKSKRQLLKPNKKESIPIKNSYFTSKVVKKGSRLVAVLSVNKNPYWEINYGSGKDVSKETIQDGKIPLKIKWLNSSNLTIPIYKDH